MSHPASEPLSGMTVNERLFSRGLLDRFDAAAKSRDRDAMLSLLHDVELSEVDASACVNAIFANPKKYGY